MSTCQLAWFWFSVRTCRCLAWCAFFFIFGHLTADRRRRLAYLFSWYYRHTYMSWYIDMYMIYIRTVLVFLNIDVCDATLVGCLVFTWQVWLLLSVLNKGALRWVRKRINFYLILDFRFCFVTLGLEEKLQLHRFFFLDVETNLVKPVSSVDGKKETVQLLKPQL